MKGATAYEWDVLGYHIMVCHLKGEYWAWKPWRRIKIKRIEEF